MSGGCSASILDQKLILSCGSYLAPTAENGLPGEITSVENTPFDLRDASDSGKLLGEAVPLVNAGGPPGFDHCFLIDGYDNNYEQRQSGGKPPLHDVATLTHEHSGRQLQLRTSMPSVQVYTANWLGARGDDNTNKFVQHNAIALNTQFYPDSPNQSSFPSTILRPEETFSHTTVYSFRTV